MRIHALASRARTCTFNRSHRLLADSSYWTIDTSITEILCALIRNYNHYSTSGLNPILPNLQSMQMYMQSRVARVWLRETINADRTQF